MIGLDLGSTYTKLALLDGGRALWTKQVKTPAPRTADGLRYEIDADAYFDQILTLLEPCEGEVDGLLLSTQMHGYLLTDCGFHPLTPYVSWQDGMGSRQLPALRARLGGDAATLSGVPLKGNLALCSLLARMDEGFALPRGARFCSLGGYVIGRLTGAHTCHMTNAAPTGLADVRGGAWNTALITRAGLSSLVFPRMVTGLAPVGKWRGIPVYPDLGDQQVCAAGAGLEPEASLHVNVGTAGLLGCLTAAWGAGAFENRPWLTDGLYLRTVSGLMGGRQVRALNERLGGDVPKVWAMMTERPTEEVTALYEEMARDYVAAAARMGITPLNVRFSGGCVQKNRALRARILDAFGMTESRPPAPNDVWQGMLALALKITENAPCTGKEI